MSGFFPVVFPLVKVVLTIVAALDAEPIKATDIETTIILLKLFDTIISNYLIYTQASCPLLRAGCPRQVLEEELHIFATFTGGWVQFSPYFALRVKINCRNRTPVDYLVSAAEKIAR